MQRVLVANRGEIALRILRTLRARGQTGIAVHTDADADAPHVAMADIARRIGAGPVGDSYLSVDAILAAAADSGAEAIHPGYGFLSENADFAQAVTAAGMVFVGPPAQAIRAMGDKAEAKRRMIAAGVPCVPGYEDAAQDDATLTAEAARLGFPLMVKAAAGGGGRGMRLVTTPGALPEALARARSEARGAFGSDALILERAVTGARHVELQVMADAHGATIHLGERDCSLQRRHQKVIEEAPAPGMTPDLRAAMGAAAVRAAQAVGYVGAGTVEFLLAPDGSFFFLEMNTRLQVEHPVTEMVTGLDLVALQLDIAAGAPLSLRQEDLRIDGHAIEARLYAEDPQAGFLPSTGRIALWAPPEGAGLRVDAGIVQGQEVSPHYDPMLAKLIAWGPDRDTARRRLTRALRDTALVGPKVNAGFLATLLDLPEFVAGTATTGTLDTRFPDGAPPEPVPEALWPLAAFCLLGADRDRAARAAGGVDADLLGWTSGPAPGLPLTLETRGQRRELVAEADGAGWRIDGVALRPVRAEGARREIALGAARHRVFAVAEGLDAVAIQLAGHVWHVARPLAGAAAAGPGDGQVLAPMPGQVLEVAVEDGAEVRAGDVLLVLEAMKMQHRITAPMDGRAAGIAARPGAQVAQGALLMQIVPTAEEDEEDAASR